MTFKLLGKWPISKKLQSVYMNSKYRKTFKYIFGIEFPTMIAKFEGEECSVYLNSNERKKWYNNLSSSISNDNLENLKKIFDESLDTSSIAAFENWANEITPIIQNKLYDFVEDKEKFNKAIAPEWKDKFKPRRIPLRNPEKDLLAKYLSFASAIRELTKLKTRLESKRLNIGILEKYDCWISDKKGLRKFKDDITIEDNKKEIKKLIGLVCNKGFITGKARVATTLKEANKIKKDEILVALMTNIEYEASMNKASAFVIEIGGVTTHASIIAREQNKPCIVSVKCATSKIKTGDLIEVDANKGKIKIIKT